MSYTELDLAQVERRVLAGERCASWQREVLKQHVAARLPTEVPLQRLAEVEATLCDLRRNRMRIRAGIAAANTLRLMDVLCASYARVVPFRDPEPLEGFGESALLLDAVTVRRAHAVTNNHHPGSSTPGAGRCPITSRPSYCART